jgi:D-sedoheptulose 7-phosphate isomerase
LAELSDEFIAVPCASPATVQELHLVALHMLCAAVDREVALRGGTRTLEGAAR